MLLCGVALLTRQGLAGVATYAVGHGLTKAALFMCAGVLLHRFATIDEFDLHGRGRAIPVVGGLMAIGALLLAGLPPFTTFMGKSLLEGGSSGGGYGWLIAVYVVVSAVTGGAILRVTGRVFLGWGPSEGAHPEQARAAHERVDETRGERGHTPVLMMLTPAVLLVLVLVLALIPGTVPGVERLAAGFVAHRDYAAWVLHGVPVALPVLPPVEISADDYLYGALSVIGAVGAAALGLFGRPLREAVPSAVGGSGAAAVEVLRGLHDGHIGDYIAWWSAGVSLVGGVCLLALR
jgi:multicomponent Na+:H+ antiporter subunit D